MSSFALGATARAAGYRLRGFDSVGSTNAEALEAASGTEQGGIWFAARQQTEGRGRRGRPWESTSGNLAATLLIIPDVDPNLLATLAFVAGIAVSGALSQLFPRDMVRHSASVQDGQAWRVALKWPNDVLADGAKLAGILLETKKLIDGRQAIAVGVGVNVVAAPSGLPYPATSLADLGCHSTAEMVFEALSDAWVEAFRLWDDGRGTAAVLAAWREAAAGIGAPVSVAMHGDVVQGIFETIDDSGRLVVRVDENERIAVTAGDVHFGATASARS